MNALFDLIILILELYKYVLFAQVILSWLVAFNVVNTRNRFVYVAGDILYRLTEPVLGPIRRVLPTFGAIDISPLVALLAVWFLQRLIAVDIAPALT